MGRCPPIGLLDHPGCAVSNLALSATACKYRDGGMVGAAGARSSRTESTGGTSLMNATVGHIGLGSARGLIVALVAPALVALTAQPVAAQTYGFATLQPATLNHTTATA